MDSNRNPSQPTAVGARGQPGGDGRAGGGGRGGGGAGESRGRELRVRFLFGEGIFLNSSLNALEENLQCAFNKSGKWLFFLLFLEECFLNFFFFNRYLNTVRLNLNGTHFRQY